MVPTNDAQRVENQRVARRAGRPLFQRKELKLLKLKDARAPRSLGALTVVRGALTEWRWTPGSEDDGTCAAEEIAARGPGLRRRVVDPGRSAAFGLGHVHDVSNRALETAVSVHAYSPPLSAMSYYAVEGGVLRRTRSELVAPGESPE